MKVKCIMKPIITNVPGGKRLLAMPLCEPCLRSMQLVFPDRLDAEGLATVRSEVLSMLVENAPGCSPVGDVHTYSPHGLKGRERLCSACGEDAWVFATMLMSRGGVA